MPTAVSFLSTVLIILMVSLCTPAQIIRVDPQESREDPRLNRSRGIRMLKQIKAAIRDDYYDRNYRGIDLDAKFDEAEDRIRGLDKNAHIFRVIAGLVLEFNDSHTTFYPPGRANRVEYGVTLQIIGDKCYVIHVKSGSDAAAKGLKPGDQIVGIGRFNPTRENLWKINYLNYALDPQPVLSYFVLGEKGAEREVKVEAQFKSIKERAAEAIERRKKKRENPYNCRTINDGIIACRLETFSIDKKYIDRMMDDISDHNKLILDLRGNGGGYVRTVEYLTGRFFDRDVKIADFVERRKTRESKARAAKSKAFRGELAVLVDSRSASASEVFARVIQIEKRGKVFGDVTAGAVMTSRQLVMSEIRGASGFERYTTFGMNLTVADLIMSDGNRLEGVGVIPDFPIGPTAFAIANETDPVLAYAANKFGGDITAESAGEFGFLKSKDEDEEKEKEEFDEEN